MSLKSQEITGIVLGVLAFFTGLLLVLVTIRRRKRRHLQQRQLVGAEKMSEKRFSTSSSSVPLTRPPTSASLFIPSISDAESRRTTLQPDDCSDASVSCLEQGDLSTLASNECIRESWLTTPAGSPKEPHYKTYSGLKRPHSICSSDSMSMYSVASAPREFHDWLFAARGSKSRVSSLVDYDIKSVHSMATSTSPDVYTQDPASVGEQRSNVPIRPLPDVSAPPVPAIPPHLRNIRPLPRPPPVVRKPVPYHSLARPAVPPRSHLRPPMEGIRE
ncbi:hypothetical protein Moror_6847 [Moniliophthora roreri MCA 2997]|uniref:Uncharacterized protein n=2 Tax=Moniliophthora roreri TaxID=221103 RepID=V2XSB0_MONRO|nr:hypothetical protein Moror_6847 [Moniliophthora roreri MCA 2997]